MFIGQNNLMKLKCFFSGMVGHVLPKYYKVFMLLILFGRLCITQPIVEVETSDQLLLRMIQYVKHFNCRERAGRGREVSSVMTVFTYKHSASYFIEY